MFFARLLDRHRALNAENTDTGPFEVGKVAAHAQLFAHIARQGADVEALATDDSELDFRPFVIEHLDAVHRDLRGLQVDWLPLASQLVGSVAIDLFS